MVLGTRERNTFKMRSDLVLMTTNVKSDLRVCLDLDCKVRFTSCCLAAVLF